MMKFRSGLIFPLLALLTVSACGAKIPWASDEKVARAAYSNNEPASVTLVTVVSNIDGSAGHSALIINASQLVLFDPAGYWYNEETAERADLFYGMTPRVMKTYIDYHARERFHVVLQTKLVHASVAEGMFHRVSTNGAVTNGFCSSATGHILNGTPGFENFPLSMRPKITMQAFGALPGVTTRRIYQDDEGKELPDGTVL